MTNLLTLFLTLAACMLCHATATAGGESPLNGDTHQDLESALPGAHLIKRELEAVFAPLPRMVVRGGGKGVKGMRMKPPMKGMTGSKSIEATPTPAPTRRPVTRRPVTERPTTVAPTRKPTTRRPTNAPTIHKTRAPTSRPTNVPTNRPTNKPTNRPTNAPTLQPIGSRRHA